jgi:hypothetical protein
MNAQQFPHHARALRAAENPHNPIMVQAVRSHDRGPWAKLFVSLTLLSVIAVRADSPAGELAFEEIPLPPLRIQGQAVHAHTQGLELVAGKCYVTARQDDVRPKRALLLRCAPAAADWDVWDITPVDAQGAVTAQDHPGGMQSDGERLWIPVAESNRTGPSIIRAYKLADMTAGARLKADFEFTVSDHIGAVAVAAESQLLFGANWDTERVYVWDFKGRLQRTLTDFELKPRGLGVISGAGGRPGLAVQDWKVVGDRLYASGLFRAPSGSPTVSTENRLTLFTGFLEPGFGSRTVTLPRPKGVMLAREGMAVSAGKVYFLPDDLGASNRMFQVSVDALTQQGDSP